MNKEYYIKIVEERFKKDLKTKKILLTQINNFYDAEEKYILKKHNYKVGNKVKLKKGTLLHGTYKNLDSLKDIVKNGLISSWFIDGRISKYPSSVGVWNLKKDYFLEDYINFYSGGTIEYSSEHNKTEIISYNELNNIKKYVTNKNCHMWTMEQTKEARFMPSLVQNQVQIGIIFNGNNQYINKIKENDILSLNLNDKIVKPFVNPNYYDKFIIDRKNKDDFFTDRESAILFGIPSCFIEGILVGRKYEENKAKLKEIKKFLPNAYICNLEGKVIAK